MQYSVQNILYDFAKDMHNLFGVELDSVVLYGSYARGDYTSNSDLDVMILVKTPEEKIRKYTDQVSDCAFEYFMKYGIDISPIIKNEKHFNYWADIIPYYRNIRKEGVKINA